VLPLLLAAAFGIWPRRLAVLSSSPKTAPRRVYNSRRFLRRNALPAPVVDSSTESAQADTAVPDGSMAGSQSGGIPAGSLFKESGHARRRIMKNQERLRGFYRALILAFEGDCIYHTWLEPVRLAAEHWEPSPEIGRCGVANGSDPGARQNLGARLADEAPGRSRERL